MSSNPDPGQRRESSPQVSPILCLLGVVALLSSITPTMKYVFQHSSLSFLSMASGRIMIGFLFLAVVTACLDWKGLRSLSIADGARFGFLGLLGVGSYVVAAYGLLYTNVTHYALIYSLQLVSVEGPSDGLERCRHRLLLVGLSPGIDPEP
jgi:drug/metabolite transporter (DMT)-like permease